MPALKACQHCGKPLKRRRKRSRRKYCGVKCMRAYQAVRKLRLTALRFEAASQAVLIQQLQREIQSLKLRLAAYEAHSERRH